MSASRREDRLRFRVELLTEVLMKDLGLTREDVDEALRDCGIRRKSSSNED